MLRTNSRSEATEDSKLLIPVPIQLSVVSNPVSLLGDSGIMISLKLAFFCSLKCPGEPIVRAYDFARAMRDAGVNVIGGFQSPIEKDCLDILLRGSQPVIICPARGLHSMRLPAAWKTAINEGRLLLLSPFSEGIRRPTLELSEKRNEFIARLADRVLFAYANPGGKTEALARKVIGMGKPVFTFDSKDNANLKALGAKAARIEDLARRSVVEKEEAQASKGKLIPE